MRICDHCRITNKEAADKDCQIQNIHINTTNIGTEMSCDLCDECRPELLKLIRNFCRK